MRNKRVSDQILILHSIQCVREELATASALDADPRVTSEILERLISLYACINTERVVEVLKQADDRSGHEGI